MPSTSKPIVTVFGGSGFVGRYVVGALAKRGYRLRVAVRRPHLAEYLKPMGGVGQIQPIRADIRNEAEVTAALAGAQHVVNLVGILQESGRQKFTALQAEGAGRIARAAAEAGVDRFVQISAIGADRHSRARYARTKAEGEAAVRAAVPGAAILRPSIVFGPEDDFFNRFARMAQLPFLPLPLIGGGKTRFQPVYVGDVAEAAARALEQRSTEGRVFELGGPEVLSFRKCLEKMLEETHRRKWLVPLPFALARLMAVFMAVLPKPPLTGDQITLLTKDNVVTPDPDGRIGTFADLGIKPVALDVILPTYLGQYRKGGQFRTIRR